jgi:hypothetical protein
VLDVVFAIEDTNNKISLKRLYTVKKGSQVSRPQLGCHYQTLLGGNNDVITELFLPRGSLVSDIPAGDGKLVNLFLRCIRLHKINHASLKSIV